MHLDFIGAGVPKAGTSWLYYALKSHPKIWLPDTKEIEFFNDEHSFYTPNRDSNYPKGLQWYAKHFADCDLNATIGEYSVNYFHDPAAPARIAKLFPNVKIIIMLRNPVERFISHCRYAYVKNKLHGYMQKHTLQTFDEVVHYIFRNEPEFVAIGYYADHLQRWRAAFSEKSLYIGQHHEEQPMSHKTLQEVYRFLSVNDQHTPDIPLTANTTRSKAAQYQALPRWHKAIAKIPGGNVIKRAVYATGAQALIRKGALQLAHRYSTAPTVTPEVRAKLYEHYQPHVAQLESMLAHSLHHWKKP